MLSFDASVRIVQFTTQLYEILLHTTLWSWVAKVDVQVRALDDGDERRQVVPMQSRHLMIELAAAGDDLTALLELVEHLRITLPHQFGVHFRDGAVRVDWDSRRRPASRADL